MSNVIEQAVMALELKLDRGEWSLVKFGDVAVKQNKSVDRENTHLKHYVKGEHMLSEDLHLREWGELADEYLGPAFIRYFEEGDILYGSRRTYLRKVTIAPFEGITSNTTFVIKANEDVIDQRLLPFIMLSEEFSQHSIRNSKGSVNPYVNWKDIAGYEFLLPPKAQQAEIAELLWAMDEVIQKETVSLNRGSQLFKTIEKEMLGRHESNNVEVRQDFILKVAKVQRGKFSHRPRNAPQFYGGNIPFIQTSEVVEAGKYILNYSQTLNEEGLKISKMFPRGTIVMTIAANIGDVGILSFDSAFTDSLVGITSDSKILEQEFLFYYLNYKKSEIDSLATQSAQKNLSIDGFKLFKVRYPVSKTEQRSIVKILDAVRENNLGIEEKISFSKSLQKSLTNQVF